MVLVADCLVVLSTLQTGPVIGGVEIGLGLNRSRQPGEKEQPTITIGTMIGSACACSPFGSENEEDPLHIGKRVDAAFQSNRVALNVAPSRALYSRFQFWNRPVSASKLLVQGTAG